MTIIMITINIIIVNLIVIIVNIVFIFSLFLLLPLFCLFHSRLSQLCPKAASG